MGFWAFSVPRPPLDRWKCSLVFLLPIRCQQSSLKTAQVDLGNGVKDVQITCWARGHKDRRTQRPAGRRMDRSPTADCNRGFTCRDQSGLWWPGRREADHWAQATPLDSSNTYVWSESQRACSETIQSSLQDDTHSSLSWGPKLCGKRSQVVTYTFHFHQSELHKKLLYYSKKTVSCIGSVNPNLLSTVSLLLSCVACLSVSESLPSLRVFCANCFCMAVSLRAWWCVGVNRQGGELAIKNGWEWERDIETKRR